jgi:hypothetical protein
MLGSMAVPGHQTIHGGDEGLRHHLCLSHDEHREPGADPAEMERWHEDEHGWNPAHRGEYGCHEHTPEDEPSEFHDMGGTGEIYRGIGVMLPDEVHRAVHDEARPAHERARALLDHLTQPENRYGGQLGRHWSTEPGVAEDFAETAAKWARDEDDRARPDSDRTWGSHVEDDDDESYTVRHAKPGTAVVFHAHEPDLADIDNDPSDSEGMVYGHSEHGEREVPLRHHADVRLRGVSWAPMHDESDPDAPIWPEYIHHDFHDDREQHTASVTAALMAHFEGSAATTTVAEPVRVRETPRPARDDDGLPPSPGGGAGGGGNDPKNQFLITRHRPDYYSLANGAQDDNDPGRYLSYHHHLSDALHMLGHLEAEGVYSPSEVRYAGKTEWKRTTPIDPEYHNHYARWFDPKSAAYRPSPDVVPAAHDMTPDQLDEHWKTWHSAQPMPKGATENWRNYTHDAWHGQSKWPGVGANPRVWGPRKGPLEHSSAEIHLCPAQNSYGWTPRTAENCAYRSPGGHEHAPSLRDMFPSGPAAEEFMKGGEGPSRLGAREAAADLLGHFEAFVRSGGDPSLFEDAELGKSDSDPVGKFDSIRYAGNPADDWPEHWRRPAERRIGRPGEHMYRWQHEDFRDATLRRGIAPRSNAGMLPGDPDRAVYMTSDDRVWHARPEEGHPGTPEWRSAHPRGSFWKIDVSGLPLTEDRTYTDPDSGSKRAWMTTEHIAPGRLSEHERGSEHGVTYDLPGGGTRQWLPPREASAGPAPGPVYYHGHGRDFRALTGIGEWDNAGTFVSHDPEVAKLYGPKVDRIEMAPDARIHKAKLARLDKMLGSVRQARAAGADVLEFHPPKDFVGHIILNPGKIASREPWDPQPHEAAARPGRGEKTCACCHGEGSHPDGSECGPCDGSGMMHSNDQDVFCPGQQQPRRRHWRQGAAEEEEPEYWHVSPHRIPMGTVLRPGIHGRGNFDESTGTHVHMTSSEDRAEQYRYLLWEQGHPEQHMYQVRPHGPVEPDPDDSEAVRTKHPVTVEWALDPDVTESDWFEPKTASAGEHYPPAERTESVRHILDHYLPSDFDTWQEVRDNNDWNHPLSREFVEDVRRNGIRRPVPIDYEQDPPRVMNGHTRTLAAEMAGVETVPTRQHRGWMDPDDPDAHGRQPDHPEHWVNAHPEWLREGAFEVSASAGDEPSNDQKEIRAVAADKEMRKEAAVQHEGELDDDEIRRGLQLPGTPAERSAEEGREIGERLWEGVNQIFDPGSTPEGRHSDRNVREMSALMGRYGNAPGKIDYDEDEESPYYEAKHHDDRGRPTGWTIRHYSDGPNAEIRHEATPGESHDMFDIGEDTYGRDADPHGWTHPPAEFGHEHLKGVLDRWHDDQESGAREHLEGPYGDPRIRRWRRRHLGMTQPAVAAQAVTPGRGANPVDDAIRAITEMAVAKGHRPVWTPDEDRPRYASPLIHLSCQDCDPSVHSKVKHFALPQDPAEFRDALIADDNLPAWVTRKCRRTKEKAQALREQLDAMAEERRGGAREGSRRQREGDERPYGDYTMRYRTEDQGESKPRHVIETIHPDGSTAGRLTWYGTTGRVYRVETAGPEDDGSQRTPLGNGEDHRRRGIATAMWDWSQEMTPKARHSSDQTTQGTAWARSLGEPRKEPPSLGATASAPVAEVVAHFAEAAAVGPDPSYDWAEALRKLRYRKRNEPEMHRGMAVSLPPELHSFVMDRNQTPDWQARAIVEHLRTQPLGMHWSADPSVSREFAKFENAKQDGTTKVIVHAKLPEVEHIETDPGKLTEHGIFRHDNFLAGEKEIPLKEGAPVRVTGVTWYGYGNRKTRGNVYGQEHFAAAAPAPDPEPEPPAERSQQRLAATDWDQFYDKIPAEIHRGLYAPQSHDVFTMPMSDENIAHGLIAAHQEEHFPYQRDRHELFGTHWTASEQVARDFSHEHEREHHAECEDHDEHFEATPVVFHAERPARHEIETDPRRLGWQNVDDHDTPEREVPIRHGNPVRVTGVSWQKQTSMGPVWHRHDLREPVWLRAEDRDSPDDPDAWNDEDDHPSAQHQGALDVVAHFTVGMGERVAARALANPHTGGDEWYHGSPWQFGGFEGDAPHSGLAYESDPEDTSHWNGQLGHHFAASHGVAEGFSRGEHSAEPEGTYEDQEPAQNVLHARLGIRNPMVYASEHDMDQEAYEHEFRAGNHHDAHHPEGELEEAREEGWEDELPHTYQYAGHGDRMRSRDEADPVYWNEHRTYHPYATGWLNNHPDKYDIARRHRQRLIDAGHDGIVYGNEFEGEQIGKGDHHLVSAIPFHAAQIDVTQRHHAAAPCIARDAAERQWPGRNQPMIPGLSEHDASAEPEVIAHFAAAGPWMQQKLFHVKPDPTLNPPDSKRFNPDDPDQHLHWRAENDEDYQPDECEHCGGDRKMRAEHAEHHQEWLEGQDWHTDWDAEAPAEGEPIHRGVATMLPQALHDRVHDTSIPVAQRARELASHIASGGGLGNFWSSDPDVSKSYAESTQHPLRYRYPKPNGEASDQTPVMVHARFPGREHIETDPDQLQHWGVYSYHIADNREIPIKYEAPLHISGISWGDSGHGGKRTYDGPEHEAESKHLDQDSHWTHHDFGDHGIQANASLAAEVVAHFAVEATAGEYGPKPELVAPEHLSDDEKIAHWDRQRRIKQDWDSRILHGISTGDITPEHAKGLGYYFDGHQTDRNGDHNWRPLPHDLYHVTTDLPGVRASGLKTRDELAQTRGGHGLGGGPDDMISLTDDHPTAQNILRAVHEFHHVVNGRYTPAQMWADAKSGVGAPRPFHEDLASYHQSGWKEGDPLPRGLDAVLRQKEIKQGGLLYTPEEMARHHGPGWTPHRDADELAGGDGRKLYNIWERDASPDLRRERAADFYKNFAAYREHAGGRENPLFFGTDTEAFAAKDPRNFAIVHARPRPGAMGHQVSALGEWRTGTGDAVEAHRAERMEDGRLREASLQRAATPSAEPPQTPHPRTDEKMRAHLEGPHRFYAEDVEQDPWEQHYQDHTGYEPQDHSHEDFYHGTSLGFPDAEDPPERIVPQGHRHFYPGVHSGEHAFATTDKNTAWAYAERAQHWRASDQPRVLRVRPTGPFEDDPGALMRGGGRAHEEGAVQSRHPWAVIGEEDIPEEHLRERYDEDDEGHTAALGTTASDDDEDPDDYSANDEWDEDAPPDRDEVEPEEEPVAHRNYRLPYMVRPPEGELIDHLHHMHGLDARTSDLYMNAKNRERWHNSEHQYKTNSTHQHDHPQGVPGEEHWPDVFSLSEHTDFAGGTRGDWARVPGNTAPFKPLRSSESVSLPEVTASEDSEEDWEDEEPEEESYERVAPERDEHDFVWQRRRGLDSGITERDPDEAPKCLNCSGADGEVRHYPEEGHRPEAQERLDREKAREDRWDRGEYDRTRYCGVGCEMSHAEDRAHGVGVHHTFAEAEPEHDQPRILHGEMPQISGPHEAPAGRQSGNYEVRNPSAGHRCHYCRSILPQYRREASHHVAYDWETDEGPYTWDEIGDRYPRVYGEDSGDGEGIGGAAAHLAFDRPGHSQEDSMGEESEHDLEFHPRTVDPSRIDYARSEPGDPRVARARRGYESQQPERVPPLILVHRHGVFQVADGHHRSEGAAKAHKPVRAYVAYSPHEDEPFSGGERGPFHGAEAEEGPAWIDQHGREFRVSYPGFPHTAEVPRPVSHEAALIGHFTPTLVVYADVHDQSPALPAAPAGSFRWPGLPVPEDREQLLELLAGLPQLIGVIREELTKLARRLGDEAPLHPSVIDMIWDMAASCRTAGDDMQRLGIASPEGSWEEPGPGPKA